MIEFEVPVCDGALAYAYNQVKLRVDEINSNLKWLEDTSMGEDKLKEGLARIDYLLGLNKQELENVQGTEEEKATAQERILYLDWKVKEGKRDACFAFSFFIDGECIAIETETNRILEGLKDETTKAWNVTEDSEKGNLISKHYEEKERLEKRLAYCAKRKEAIDKLEKELIKESSDAEWGYKEKYPDKNPDPLPEDPQPEAPLDPEAPVEQETV